MICIIIMIKKRLKFYSSVKNCYYDLNYRTKKVMYLNLVHRTKEKLK